MDLTTRCPQCASEFPISLQQLQLRKGYIRCVDCAHIFDGYEAVVPAPSTGPSVLAPPAPTEAAHEPTFSASHTSSASIEPQFVVSSPASSTPPIRTRDTSGSVVEPPTFTVRDAEPHSNDTQSHNISEPGFAAERRSPHDTPSGLYIEPRPDRQAGPEFIHNDERSGLGLGGWFWSLLVLFGVVGVVLQAAYIYRVQIASELPALRPALERYCEALGCTVEYPRRLAQISIMDSSLQAQRNAQDEAADGSRLVLNVVMRNNFDRPQQWPSMSIDLVDFAGVVAARRTLAPADYLPGLSLQRPFPAKSEVRVSVPLTVNDLQINGYQLNTFFP